MRIHSGFRDYYDVGAGWDHEPQPVFVRTTRTTRLVDPWTHTDDPEAAAVMKTVAPTMHHRPELGRGNVDSVVVFFCGEAHHGYEWNQHTYWRFEDLAAAMPEPPKAPVVSGRVFAQSLDTYGDSLYRRLGCPIFSLSEFSSTNRAAVLTRNPRLSTWGFARVVDPYRAWQALERMVGSTLATQVDPPDPIDDGLRRDAHGFDDRSFKKGPGGPTRKRKKR